MADSCEQRGGLISVMTGPGEAMGVLKAMALGANGVFIGRPPLWALAVGGVKAVVQFLELLRIETATSRCFWAQNRLLT